MNEWMASRKRKKLSYCKVRDGTLAFTSRRRASGFFTVNRINRSSIAVSPFSEEWRAVRRARKWLLLLLILGECHITSSIRRRWIEINRFPIKLWKHRERKMREGKIYSWKSSSSFTSTIFLEDYATFSLHRRQLSPVYHRSFFFRFIFIAAVDCLNRMYKYTTLKKNNGDASSGQVGWDIIVKIEKKSADKNIDDYGHWEMSNDS